MGATTPNLALPYPIPADTVDVPRDVKALADKLDAMLSVPTKLFATGGVLDPLNTTPRAPSGAIINVGASGAGVYVVTVTADMQATAAGWTQMYLTLFKNNVAIPGQDQTAVLNEGTVPAKRQPLMMQFLVTCAANDVLALVVSAATNSGGTSCRGAWMSAIR